MQPKYGQCRQVEQENNAHFLLQFFAQCGDQLPVLKELEDFTLRIVWGDRFMLKMYT